MAGVDFELVGEPGQPGSEPHLVGKKQRCSWGKKQRCSCCGVAGRKRCGCSCTGGSSHQCQASYTGTKPPPDVPVPTFRLARRVAKAEAAMAIAKEQPRVQINVHVE